MLSRKPEAINSEDSRSRFGDVLWCIAKAGERRSLRQHLISMTSDWGSLSILLFPDNLSIYRFGELHLKTMGESTPFSEQLLFVKSLKLHLNPTHPVSATGKKLMWVENERSIQPTDNRHSNAWNLWAGWKHFDACLTVNEVGHPTKDVLGGHNTHEQISLSNTATLLNFSSFKMSNRMSQPKIKLPRITGK